MHLFFVDKTGASTAVSARVGVNLLHAAQRGGVALEGACECSLACSTCHVVLPPALASALPPACDEEEDMLDLAFGLTATCVCRAAVAAGSRAAARALFTLAAPIAPIARAPQLAAGLPGQGDREHGGR